MKKLKIATLHINSVSEDSISTGVRLVKYLSEFFDCPFIHNQKTALAYMDTYDVLFVKYGILAFCDYRKELFEIYKKAKRIIAIEEDYTMTPDYRLTKLNPSLEVWTTLPWRAEEIGGVYINWNRMTFQWDAKWQRAQLPSPALYGLGYYGAYRPDRVEFFEKYFVNTPYTVYVSSFQRNHLKWRDLNSEIKIFAPFKNRKQISCFQSVLYIEDKFSNTHYCSPANRFYECLSVGVPMLFDKSCIGTFKKAGMDISQFTVDSQRDVVRALKRTKEISAEQRSLWFRNYKEELFEDVKQAVRKHIGEKYAIQGNYPNV